GTDEDQAGDVNDRAGVGEAAARQHDGRRLVEAHEDDHERHHQQGGACGMRRGQSEEDSRQRHGARVVHPKQPRMPGAWRVDVHQRLCGGGWVWGKAQETDISVEGLGLRCYNWQYRVDVTSRPCRRKSGETGSGRPRDPTSFASDSPGTNDSKWLWVRFATAT